jgi:hypothetical protein
MIIKLKEVWPLQPNTPLYSIIKGHNHSIKYMNIFLLFVLFLFNNILLT